MTNTQSESWLLLAIIYANINNKTDLSSIIGMGDAIMHAIFNIDEINDGIMRLLKDDFITIKNKSFFITNKTKKLYSKIDKKYKIMFKQLDEIEKNIQSIKTTPSNQDKIKLSKKEYEDAVKQYINNTKN